jgi:DNA-binding PadR family transcriptional regulator
VNTTNARSASVSLRIECGAPPENLAVLLREPFRAMTDELMVRLAARGHPEVRARMTKQSMTELVAHLERHGYVERVPDPADGRAKLVRATERGREVYAIARDATRDVQDRLDARLAAD